MSAAALFRLALVGAGRAGEILHLPAALASELVDVAAIVDRDVERASALARKFGLQCEIAKEIADVRGPIDGAIIAVPNNIHKAVAFSCAERGIHCLIEKPLAPSVEDAEDFSAYPFPSRVRAAMLSMPASKRVSCRTRSGTRGRTFLVVIGR